MLRAKLELHRVIAVLALGWIMSVASPLEAQAPGGDVAADATPNARPALGEAGGRAIAEILRLEDERRFEVMAFNRYLGDPDPEVRRRAVLALGRIGNEQALVLLSQALQRDTAAAVRAAAAFALGIVPDSSVAPFGLYLDGAAWNPAEAPEVRAEAVASLGKIAARVVKTRPEYLWATSAIGAILNQAAQPDSAEGAPPRRIVEEALLAVWRLGNRVLFIGDVAELSRSPDPELRWRATYALMRMQDPHAIGALVERASDPDPLVRALAMRGLAPPALLTRSGLRTEAIGALAAGTRDPHPHVRINAARALAPHKSAESTTLIVPLLRDPDPNVVLAAAEALRQSDRATAAGPLAELARDAAAPRAIRAAALGSLVTVDPELALPLIESLAKGEAWLDRFYASRALAATNGTVGSEIVVELARDHDVRVAATALRVLAEWPHEENAGLKTLFIEQLGSADVGIRAAALRGLAKHATAADLPLLLDAYDRARHDSDNDAIRAAVAALGALAEEGVPVQNSFFRRFERSPDPIVRREVRDALGPGEWGDIFPVETERDLEYYENIVRTYIAPHLAGAPLPRAIIHTAGGDITIELAAPDAPLTVANFITLAERGYFNGFRWHRVVPNFVLQDGDPRGDGSGGPGYSIRDEFNQIRYLRGTVGMALDGPDTGGSQYFIAHAPQPHLDGNYTVFGRVVEGMEIADAIVQDDAIGRIEIVRTKASQ